jgi:hypothetical protein
MLARLKPSIGSMLGSRAARRLRRASGRLVFMAESLVAVNPDVDSRLPYLLRVPQPGRDLLFRTSGTWPRVKALYCYPVGLHEWPTDAVIIERLALRSCQRRGAAIDLIVRRSRENRSQLVFTTARGRDAVFLQSPRVRKQARPNVRTPTARAHGIEELQILVDTHEQYAYRFGTQQVSTVRRALPCGPIGSWPPHTCGRVLSMLRCTVFRRRRSTSPISARRPRRRNRAPPRFSPGHVPPV